MKASLKVDAYSAGERVQILELCIINIVTKQATKPGVEHRLVVIGDLNQKLVEHKVMGLSDWGSLGNKNTIPFGQLVDHLKKTDFLDSKSGTLFVTQKGRRYHRQCSKRVRMAAAKISCDVLDRLAEAVR